VGTSRAWDALNDNVTELGTPTSANYVLSGEWTLRVGLETTPIAGADVTSSRAWIYTPNANAVTLEVRDGAGNRLSAGRFASTGWHSLWVPLNGAQSQLDNAYLTLRGAIAYGSGRASVYAAFLRLRLDRPEPPTNGPEPRVYWGSWMDGDVYGGGLTDAPWDGTTWSTFESHAGKPASIVHFGQPAPWAQIFYPAPLELTDRRGAIPLMDMGNSGASLRSIASGSYDSYLTNWARAVRNYGQPFFFRWLWEMNGTWFPWGSEAAGNPALYVSAWRRFHDIAEAQGATNITWVWCPNAIFPGSTSLTQLYPGNSYVDWTCIDGYNFGLNPLKYTRWTSFNEVISPTYNALTSLAPTKPIMIGETASTEVGGSKPSWIANALGNAIPNSFPRIKAVNWFNWNVFEGGGRWDWPIESTAASQAAFASAISSPYYAGNEFGDLPPLTRIQPLP
jgi:Glycosyl hydrolase family 26